MKVDLDGKVALVTGAARGIGRAIADRLAASGASVAYTDVDAEGAIAAAGGDPRHLAMGMDVREQGQIDEVVAAIGERWGRLDILVNNAGIGTKAHERVDVDQVDPEVWGRIIAIDLTGPFLVTRAAVKLMIPSKAGRVVNIASVVGLVPLRLQSAYVAAKAGLVNLTRGMALELARHGILVNAVAPGSTATDGWRQWLDAQTSQEAALYERLLSHIPLGRPASTAEIAHGVLFLLDPETTYVTGHTLVIDGGWTAGFARDF
jgi:NAD(P)-dependent dehydrogenase (short-subunit alcohol dehydrogenase family)